ncbi:MAG TPA: hypothetical protein VI455_08110 [Terriglobia bacterium]
MIQSGGRTRFFKKPSPGLRVFFGARFQDFDGNFAVKTDVLSAKDSSECTPAQLFLNPVMAEDLSWSQHLAYQSIC